jgi:predicted hydrocarbon binding protein
MDARSLSFSLGKSFDPAELAKKVPELKPGPGGRFLQAKVGRLLVILFPNGRARITVPGEDLSVLRREIAANAIGVGRVLEAARVAAGSDVDIGDALGGEGHDLVEYAEIAQIPFAQLRPTVGERVSAEVIDALILGASQVLAEFQTDRFLSQAGELMGRQAVRGAKLADAKALQELVTSLITGKGLGSARFEAGAQGVDHVVVVEECFCAGSPVYGRPLCATLRGVIRGAYSAFRRAENTAVHEVRCWGLGHTECAFEVRTLSI